MTSHITQSHLTDHHAPGHWVLARLGKKVLRPGGLQATNLLLANLAISSKDRVVEFAPGMGLTASRIVDLQPATYTAVERDEAVAKRLQGIIGQSTYRIVNASAEESSLPSGQTNAVIGEAMLTMQTIEKKREIISEAARLLTPGGRYGIHEIALIPEDISEKTRQQIRAGMSKAIHHGVMAQTVKEWRDLLEEAGFTDVRYWLVPFRLLEPSRLIADEGLGGALRFAANLLRMPDARRRVLTMRRTFRRYSDHLSAIVIIAKKADTNG